ncbi:hypothetical protein BTR23_12080 [Alkalihalophilus pseudofirmus]|uniref:DUF2198 family protein n=1 Tax=Alkalihalobacterium alkalinitrilicum TaxID=427920 RepID=UPI00094C71AF|nr:DUF2198 family protein [Alkalihalobacterium alkalinitrilicum]OLO38125.1 hypothetical protein BTR23_12080 [Alkalihalophilus pseudofirmus]
MVNIFLAIGLPVLLMVVGTRIAYSVIGAMIVTLMIMIFAVQIHHMSSIPITLAIISFLAGLRISMQMRKRSG